MTTFAGSGNEGEDFLDGTGTNADFANPIGLAIDAAGYLYVADGSNARIRRISPTGEVRTVAGMGPGYGYADGPGDSAVFQFPAAIAVDPSGNLYLSDSSTIRKIQRIVSTGAK